MIIILYRITDTRIKKDFISLSPKFEEFPEHYSKKEEWEILIKKGDIETFKDVVGETDYID